MTSPSLGCSSGLDCSLNGGCVERGLDSFPFESASEGEHNRWEVTTATACVCDKPWYGEHCEKIRFVPTRGKHQRENISLTATAANAIAPQGYGMIPNITTWGGGILVEPINSTNNMYHLYVSRMSNDCPLEHYGTNSRVDHAVSSSITGPYEFSDVAIPTFSHNPAPVELWKPTNEQWKYAIFHLGAGTNGTDGGYDCRSSWKNNNVVNDVPILGDDGQIRSSKTQRRLLREKTTRPPIGGGKANIHVSKSLNGPWVTLLDHNLVHCNNPAPWVNPVNGTLFVVCNNGKSTIFKSEHGDVSGTYEFVTEFHPGAPGSTDAHEDPFLYTDANGNFHIIYHTYQYKGSSEECQDTVVSSHVYSRDGYEWHTGSTPPYASQVEVSFPQTSTSEGEHNANAVKRKETRIVTLTSRERPKLLVKEGLITHIVEAVCGAPGCNNPKPTRFCVDCKYLNWDFTLVSILDSS